MKMPGNHRKSKVMFISSMLIFGTVGVFRRYIPFSSAFLAFSRGITGGVFLLAFMRLKQKNSGEKLPVQIAVELAVTGALIGINWILLFEAYNYTTVGIATLCYYMQPTIVMLLSPLFFQERLTRKKAICATTAVIGMVLVSGVIGGQDIPAGNIRGILFGLGAAVFYSAVVIMNKRISGVDAWRKTAIQLFSAGVIMIPYMLFTGIPRCDEIHPLAVALLLIVGIVHTGIAYVLYFGGMDGLKAQSAAIFSYIDPVSALLFSAFLLKEPLDPIGITGAVLIIGSAVISEM